MDVFNGVLSVFETSCDQKSEKKNTISIKLEKVMDTELDNYSPLYIFQSCRFYRRCHFYPD